MSSNFGGGGDNFDYGSGILQAYLARQRLNQQATQMANEHQIALDTLAQHQKQLDQEAAYQKEQLTLNALVTKRLMQEHYNNIYGKQGVPEQSLSSLPIPTAGTQTNYDPTTGQLQGETPQMSQGTHWTYTDPTLAPLEKDIPGISQFDIDPNYQQRLKDLGFTEADIAGAKAQAAGQPKIDVANIQAGAKTDTAGINVEGKKDVATIQQTGATHRQDMKDIASELVANIKAAASKYVHDNGMNSNPDDVSDYYQGVISGRTKISDVPTKGGARAAVLGMMNQDGTQPVQQKDLDALRSSTQLDGLIQDMRNAANVLPSQNDKGATITQLGNYMQSKLPISTKLNTAMNEVASRSPQIVRNLFGIENGRITNVEIQKALQGMVAPGMTREAANTNIDKIERDLNNRMVNDHMGNLPLSQKISIIHENSLEGRYTADVIDPKTKRQVTIPIEQLPQALKQGLVQANAGPITQR